MESGALAVIVGMVMLAAPVGAQEKVAGTYGQGPDSFSLATGSPGELGLLKMLGEAFAQEMGGKTTLLAPDC